MPKVPFLEKPADMPRIVINVASVGLTPEQFFRLCRDNPDTRIELTARKEIVIMSPTNKRTGMMNAEIIRQLANWAEQDGSGIAFDSNTLFTLPNGAKRSPDASWMLKSRSDAFVPDPAEYFDQICPDFVLELWSPSDILKEVHAKMAEYIANGARLGFLLYPPKRRVWVYRPNQEPQCLEQPQTVSGDPELPGFALNLTEVWQ